MIVVPVIPPAWLAQLGGASVSPVALPAAAAVLVVADDLVTETDLAVGQRLPV